MPHGIGQYCFIFALAVGAAPILWIRGRQSWRRSKAVSWQEITATIQSIEVPNPERGRRILVSYSYFVDEYRSGEYNLFFSDDSVAYEIARLLKNASVSVRYDKRNPDVSICTDEELFLVATRIREQEKLREVPSVSELQFDVAQPAIDPTSYGKL